MATVFDSNINNIRNILDQVSGTTLEAGHLKGHVVTKAQLSAVNEFLDKLAGESPRCLTPTTESFELPEPLARSKLALLDRISVLETKLTLADRAERTELNHEIGKARSKLAAIERSIKKL
jgi:hypothetical protein